ncbi:PASTA domain-containing protein [Actinomadura sp. 3N508]|uniref:PASTA domain-containing protein n=1 Tax=Actinomadura sp. 3N508 TaxID=3375153 RepID=UPI0037B4B236
MALLAGGFFGLGLLAGCATGYGIGSAPPTDQAAAASPFTPAVSETPSRAASTEPSPSPTTENSTAPAEPTVTPTTKIRVPNVVGKNHQEAQDFMQSHGLYNLREQDATGQNRILVWDRNWVVVRQTPKAGTLVAPDQAITLFAKKFSE